MPTVRYTVAQGEVIAEKRGGTRSLYVPDPLGTTIALIDNTQTITDTWVYWPYGEVKTRTGTTATPFQYVGTQGYYHDSDGRAYVRSRELDKAKARWMTEDPIQRERVSATYRYASNRPTTTVDPSGEKAADIIEDIIRRIIDAWEKGPGYGNYCGGDRWPFRLCPWPKYTGLPGLWPPYPPGVDVLDRCCRDHDWVYAFHDCPIIGKREPACNAADRALCECLKKVDCDKAIDPDHCKIVLPIAQFLFCTPWQLLFRS